MAPEINVGCSGYQKSHHVYYEYFNNVEIQQTFYNPPQVKTALKWRSQAPENFEFAVKAWQIITHEPTSPTYKRLIDKIPPGEWKQYGYFKPTLTVHSAWLTTRRVAEALQAEVILFQCPAQFTPTPEHVSNLRAFIRSIDRGPFTLAWEPRGEWPDDLVGKVCNDLGLIHAVDPFLIQPQTTGVGYYRLHGGKDYSHSYTDGELEELYLKCLTFQKIYCFFNNVSMWNDGLRFKRIAGIEYG